MADSDYGSTLTKGGVAIGPCMVIDWPELTTDSIETTNHGSGGYREKIPSGLIGVGDITLMVLIEANLYATVLAEMEAKTVSSVVIADAQDTFTCNGFYLSVKKEAQDAQSPNAIRASVVITFTGEPTLA